MERTETTTSPTPTVSGNDNFSGALRGWCPNESLGLPVENGRTVVVVGGGWVDGWVAQSFAFF